MGYDYDAIIIGAGVGGLTAASLMAKEGLKVLVLERLERVGGCCSNYDVNGFKPEVGAVFVIGHELYYKLFELLDLPLEEYLDWDIIDPVYQVYFEDGNDVALPRDIDEMARVVRDIAPRDVDGYYRYCRDLGKVQDIITGFTRNPMPEIRDLTKLSSLARLFATKAIVPSVPVQMKLGLNNLEKVVKSYFTDPKLQLIFGWENMYAGLPAHRCFGLFAMITYMGHMGYFYPKGGMISIPKALARIAQDFGAELRLEAEVDGIVLEGREAKGVRMADGEVLTARAVVSNTHSRFTYFNLLRDAGLPGWVTRTVRRQPCSIPAPMFYVGLSERLDSVKAHMSLVAQGNEQVDNIWTDFYDRGLLYRAADGMYLVIDPSFDDPDLAPPGKQVLYVIYIAPYKLKYHDWDDIADDWACECIDYLDKRCYPGLASRVEWMDSVPPTELERRLNVAEGAFFGIEMSLPNMGPFRPNYRSRLIDRLYQAGQSTNPGLGVPGAMISGMAVASLLLNDWPKRLS
ncbi:MAG: phytoene desaturase family protein [Actinomycetota bacterium]|nr:phytoene desaturase family protein [Actinomycetota bacterium]MDD5666008.1 phytoene desaturase family protein [Actinomycetota bacterium]